MNIKKLLLGGIAGGVAFFLLGWLIFGMLLMDFMSNNPGTAGNVHREEPEFLYLAVGNLLFGLMFAYIFIKGNIQSFGSGLISGGIIGALMSAGFNCIMYGTSTITSKTAMAADVGGMTLMCALAGAVIGMVLGMGSNRP